MEHGDGIIFLIAAIFALLLFCVKSKVLALLSAIVVGVMAWYEYQSTMEILNGMGILAGVVDKEFGFYALIIGAAFLVIGAVINLMDN